MPTPQEMMESEYSFSEKNGCEFIQVKSGDDFPWSLRDIGLGEWRLAQAYSPRSYVKASFKKVKDFKSRDDALRYIIRSHNKACKHTPNWNLIPVV
jgi:hypothetical protein